MRTTHGDQCESCNKFAAKGDKFFEFVLGPMPMNGPNCGRDFPGVGVVRNGIKVLAPLLSCDACMPRIVKYVKTGDPMVLPPGRLRSVLLRIALKHPSSKAHLHKMLAPERLPRA